MHDYQVISRSTNRHIEIIYNYQSLLDHFHKQKMSHNKNVFWGHSKWEITENLEYTEK